MMGIRMPALANSRRKSRPLTPGSLTSRTRQLGASDRLRRRKSCAVPKPSERKPTDLSMPWMEARAESSVSTTNTVGGGGGVIHDYGAGNIIAQVCGHSLTSTTFQMAPGERMPAHIISFRPRWYLSWILLVGGQQ